MRPDQAASSNIPFDSPHYSNARQLSYDEGSAGVDWNTTGPTVWLDITDLFRYTTSGNTTVTGIQRVIVNLVSHAGLAGRPVVPISFEKGVAHRSSLRQTIELVSRLQSGSSSEPDVTRDWAVLAAERRPAELVAGDTLILPGAFSEIGSVDLIARLHATGVRVVLLIYDLIQISHPEFVSPQAHRSALRTLVDLSPFISSILTISHYVAAEVRAFLEQRMELKRPVRAVPLATELAPVPSAAKVGAKVAKVAEGDFILSVGTLEPRKNQIYLVRVWSELRRIEGLVVPKLVLVGKWGRRGGELDRLIEELGCLNDWLFVFDRASDAELQHLYERCLFTSFPSFAEGWGLPVGESLARGKPCIASERTSVPEVGGSFVRLIDPSDVQAGVRTFETVLRDRGGLSAWAERIRSGFVAKPWSAYAGELFEATAQAESEVPHFGSKFEPGRLYYFGTDELVRLHDNGELLTTARSALVQGWRPPGDEGVWAAEREASLRLSQAAAPSGDVVVFLKLRALGSAAAAKLLVGIGEVQTTIGEVRDGGIVKARGRAEPDGSVVIVLSYSNHAHHLQGRPTSFGLEAVGFHHAVANEERMEILEALALDLGRHKTPSTATDQASRTSGALALRLLVERRTQERPRWHPLRLVSLIWLWAAWRARKRGQWTKAEACYRRMFRLGGLGTRHWVQFGHVLKEQGALAAAAGAYRMALDFDPEHSVAVSHLRHCLRELDDL
ncbi:glycosyltransferase family 4 protein [Micromonospora sp. STR1s_5]|nr:glycosyltransferase family 4 protein [Micromonospora sp. STR1s_5]